MYTKERVYNEHVTIQQKCQIRLLKQSYYDLIRPFIAHEDVVVELGSGAGWIKECNSAIITSDIFPLPWLDVASSAESLSFKDESCDVVIALDVIHHLKHPGTFFSEVSRVLKPGKRLIIIEPYVSFGSWLMWHCFHHEYCTMHESGDLTSQYDRENNARPTLWFCRMRDDIKRQMHPLLLECIRYYDIIYYPLSGGLKPWSLIPRWCMRTLLRCDRFLGKWLGKYFGYRMLMVFKKQGIDAHGSS